MGMEGKLKIIVTFISMGAFHLVTQVDISSIFVIYLIPRKTE